MVRIRSDIGPRAPQQDGAAIEYLLVEQLAATIPELADRRCVQYAVPATGIVLAPLVRLRIVEKQGQAFPVTVGTICIDLLQLAAAIPDFADSHCAILQARDVRLPGSEVEIEIVLPIPFRGCHACRS